MTTEWAGAAFDYLCNFEIDEHVHFSDWPGSRRLESRQTSLSSSHPHTATSVTCATPWRPLRRDCLKVCTVILIVFPIHWVETTKTHKRHIALHVIWPSLFQAYWAIFAFFLLCNYCIFLILFHLISLSQSGCRCTLGCLENGPRVTQDLSM